MGLRDTLAQLAANRLPAGQFGIANSRLTDFAAVGSNPGALVARVHVPDDLPPGAPLVVVLHGCTQTAAGYDAGTGWSDLADRAGFAVLFPEQTRANSSNLCFNWFQPQDIARRGGEAESIAQMVDAMVDRHALDRSRVFVTGLSAGGAMAAVMLATYPDRFAGGAIIGGLPYGCASGVGQALERMAGRGGGRSAPVAAASGITPDRWPTISVWHGTADPTVVVGNMDDTAAQWRDVHGVDVASAEVERSGNWERRRWAKDGRTVVETWRITGMGHGVPIDPAGPEGLGTAGAYMLAIGVDSTAEIARSFGLIGAQAMAPRRATAAKAPKPAAPARLPAVVAAKPRPAPPAPAPSSIQTVIEDALRSAGLMR